MKLKTITMALLAATCTIMPIKASANDAQPIERMILFDHGDMGSKFWRIPALVTTNDGTVIAVADKRNESNKDLPNEIDIAMRRSYDAGKTWTEPEIILKADGVGGYGDAALGVHRPTGDIVIVCAHGNGLWEATPEDQQRLVVTRSSDDGKTWSAPVDITAMVYDPVEGVSPLKANSGFASSGAMLCDDEGRLMFVVVAHTNDIKWGPLACYLVYSEDGGYTWKISEEVADYGDESKVVQLADGSYLMSIRNRHKAGRLLSRTTTPESYWTEPRVNAQLIDPACNGDLITLSPDEVKQLGIADLLYENGKYGLILHSLANDAKDRKNVSVLASDDLGVNWRKIYTVTPDRSSYSALAIMPDGNLGIFSEEDNPKGGFTLWFTKVSLKDILQ